LGTEASLDLGLATGTSSDSELEESETVVCFLGTEASLDLGLATGTSSDSELEESEMV